MKKFSKKFITKMKKYIKEEYLVYVTSRTPGSDGEDRIVEGWIIEISDDYLTMTLKSGHLELTVMSGYLISVQTA